MNRHILPICSCVFIGSYVYPHHVYAHLNHVVLAQSISTGNAKQQGTSIATCDVVGCMLGNTHDVK